jgi:hypothetical protein
MFEPATPRLSRLYAKFHRAARWLRALPLAAVALSAAGCTFFLLLRFPEISADDPLYIRALMFDVTWGYPVFTPSPPPSSVTGHPGAKAVTAATPTSLSTFTPTAAFQGSQSILVGGALNPGSRLAGTLLARESNCSLTQYSFADTADGATPALTILPGLDAYAHRVSGLTTAAGVFPKGCTEPRLGTASSPGTYLGRASNGDLLAVSVNSNRQINLLRVNASGKVVSTTALGGTNSSFTVAAADLNGDGIADIVKLYHGERPVRHWCISESRRWDL